jgi:hypothetical protein
MQDGALKGGGYHDAQGVMHAYTERAQCWPATADWAMHRMQPDRVCLPLVHTSRLASFMHDSRGAMRSCSTSAALTIPTAGAAATPGNHAVLKTEGDAATATPPATTPPSEAGGNPGPATHAARLIAAPLAACSKQEVCGGEPAVASTCVGPYTARAHGHAEPAPGGGHWDIVGPHQGAACRTAGRLGVVNLRPSCCTAAADCAVGASQHCVHQAAEHRHCLPTHRLTPVRGTWHGVVL